MKYRRLQIIINGMRKGISKRGTKIVIIDIYFDVLTFFILFSCILLSINRYFCRIKKSFLTLENFFNMMKIKSTNIYLFLLFLITLKNMKGYLDLKSPFKRR